MNRTCRRSRRAFTLIEVVIAASLMSVVILTGMGVFLYSSKTWARSMGMSQAEQNSEMAVRVIAAQLRQAVTVTINSGSSISYSLPATNSSGDYAIPTVSDGVARSIQVSGSTITITTAGVNRTICTGVIGTDPLSAGGTGAYSVFTAGNSGIVRSINVMVVTQFQAQDNQFVKSRSREIVYLRNIPILNPS